MKTRIGVDIDDTLCNFCIHMNVWVNSVLNTAFTIEDYDARKLGEIWNIPQEQADKLVEQYVLSYTSTLEPIEDGYDTLKSLLPYCDFYAITARDNRLTKQTHEWINSYYPNIFKDIIICNHYGTGEKKCKTDVCKELGIKIMIDDNPANIKCDSIHTIIFDQQWNKNYNNPRITSWKELTIDFINKYIN